MFFSHSNVSNKEQRLRYILASFCTLLETLECDIFPKPGPQDCPESSKHHHQNDSNYHNSHVLSCCSRGITSIHTYTCHIYPGPFTYRPHAKNPFNRYHMAARIDKPRLHPRRREKALRVGFKVLASGEAFLGQNLTRGSWAIGVTSMINI